MAVGEADQRWEHGLFPILLCAFGVAAGATLAVPSPQTIAATVPPELALVAPESAPRGFVQVTVEDVVFADGGATSAALLVGATDEVVLPLFLGADEGRLLHGQLGADSPEEPSQLAETVAAMGAAVERIELAGGTEPVRSRVVLLRDGEELSLDVETSDALRLAIATGRPVYAARGMVADRGFRKADAPSRAGELPSHLRSPEHL